MNAHQYVRRPLVSDAPASLQMPWAAYLTSTYHDLVTFETWFDWIQFGSGKVEHWEIGKGSVKPMPTARHDSK